MIVAFRSIIYKLKLRLSQVLRDISLWQSSTQLQLWEVHRGISLWQILTSPQLLTLTLIMKKPQGHLALIIIDFKVWLLSSPQSHLALKNFNLTKNKFSIPIKSLNFMPPQLETFCSNTYYVECNSNTPNHLHKACQVWLAYILGFG